MLKRKKDKKDNVLSCIRLRPFTDEEIAENHESCWQVSDDSIHSLDKNDSTIYNYDYINYFSSDNQILYEKTAKNIVWSAMDGLNGVVMAYGRNFFFSFLKLLETASGKTYSMMGIDEQPGIIPQAIDDVFSYIREQAGDREYLLRVAYVEIYNETIRDLLAPDTTELRILEDKRRGTYISPLKEEIVTSPKQVMRVIQKGETHRSWGTTDYNIKSSRSHTILQIIIESRDSSSRPSSPKNTPSKHKFINTGSTVRISQLNLIDLAGSEKADTDSARRKEGAFINKSLLTLGSVISKITDDKGGHVPYRDSKLTRVLQTSFSGNSKISVICTVSPSRVYQDESLNTLKFLQKVKKVPVKAHRNIGLDDQALLQKYKAEIDDLKKTLLETNLKLERARSQSDVTLLIAEKQMFEQQLHESHLVRLALKERIDHLTKMILTSHTITPNTILDWNVPTLKNKRSSVMLEGLLPNSSQLVDHKPIHPHPEENGDESHITTSSPSSSPNRISAFNQQRQHKLIRMSRQMTDKDFFQKHILEIDLRDEKIKHFQLLISRIKGLHPEVDSVLDLFGVEDDLELIRGKDGVILSMNAMKENGESMAKDNEELEIIIQNQHERLEFMENLAKERDEELESLRRSSRDRGVSGANSNSDDDSTVVAKHHHTFEHSQLFSEMFLKMDGLRERVGELEGQNRLLKCTISELRNRIRHYKDNEYEELESKIGSPSIPKLYSSRNSSVGSDTGSMASDFTFTTITSHISIKERIKQFNRN